MNKCILCGNKKTPTTSAWNRSLCNMCLDLEFLELLIHRYPDQIRLNGLNINQIFQLQAFWLQHNENLPPDEFKKD